MKDYYQKSINALQLAGLSDRTQQCYTRSVRQLVGFYKQTPNKITEKQLQEYFLHRRNEDKWSAATLRIAQRRQGRVDAPGGHAQSPADNIIG